MEEEHPSLKARVKLILESHAYAIVMALVILFILFVDDITVLIGRKDSNWTIALLIIKLIIFISFLLELIVCLWVYGLDFVKVKCTRSSFGDIHKGSNFLA